MNGWAETQSQGSPNFVVSGESPKQYKSPLRAEDGGGKTAAIAAGLQALEQLFAVERAIRGTQNVRDRMTQVGAATIEGAKDLNARVRVTDFTDASFDKISSYTPESARTLEAIRHELKEGYSGSPLRGGSSFNDGMPRSQTYSSQFAYVDPMTGKLRMRTRDSVYDETMELGDRIRRGQYEVDAEQKEELFKQIGEIEKANLPDELKKLGDNMQKVLEDQVRALERFLIDAKIRVRNFDYELERAQRDIEELQKGTKMVHGLWGRASDAPGEPVERGIGELVQELDQVEKTLEAEKKKLAYQEKCQSTKVIGLVNPNPGSSNGIECSYQNYVSQRDLVQRIQKDAWDIRNELGGDYASDISAKYRPTRDGKNNKGLVGSLFYLEQKYIPSVVSDRNAAAKEANELLEQLRTLRAKVGGIKFLEESDYVDISDREFRHALEEKELNTKTQEAIREKTISEFGNAGKADAGVVKTMLATTVGTLAGGGLLYTAATIAGIAVLASPVGWLALGLSAAAGGAYAYFQMQQDESTNANYRAGRHELEEGRRYMAGQKGATEANEFNSRFKAINDQYSKSVAEGLQKIKKTLSTEGLLAVMKSRDGFRQRLKDIKEIDPVLDCIARGQCGVGDLGALKDKLLGQLAKPGQALSKKEWVRAARAMIRAEKYNSAAEGFKSIVSKYVQPYIDAQKGFKTFAEKADETRKNSIRSLEKEYVSKLFNGKTQQERDQARYVLNSRGINFRDLKTGAIVGSLGEWERRRLALDNPNIDIGLNDRMMSTGEFVVGSFNRLNSWQVFGNQLTDGMMQWGSDFNSNSFESYGFKVGAGTGASNMTGIGAIPGNIVGAFLGMKNAHDAGVYNQLMRRDGGYWGGAWSAMKSFGSGYLTTGTFGAGNVAGVTGLVGRGVSVGARGVGNFLGITENVGQVVNGFRSIPKLTALLPEFTLGAKLGSRLGISQGVADLSTTVTSWRAYKWSAAAAGTAARVPGIAVNGIQSYLGYTVPGSVVGYGFATGPSGALTGEGLMGAVTAPWEAAMGAAGYALGSAGSALYPSGAPGAYDAMRAYGVQGMFGNATAGAFGVDSAEIAKAIDRSEGANAAAGQGLYANSFDYGHSGAKKGDSFLQKGAGLTAAHKAMENWAFTQGGFAPWAAGAVNTAKILGDVQAFGVAGRLTGSMATSAFGRTAVADLAGMTVNALPMYDFYKQQVGNMAGLLDPNNHEMTLGRYTYDLGSMALGVGGGHAGKGGSFKAIVKEGAKLATAGVVGQFVGADAVAAIGAFGLPVMQAGVGAARQEFFKTKITPALEGLLVDQRGSMGQAGGIEALRSSRNTFIETISPHLTRHGADFYINGIKVDARYASVLEEVWNDARAAERPVDVFEEIRAEKAALDPNAIARDQRAKWENEVSEVEKTIDLTTKLGDIDARNEAINRLESLVKNEPPVVDEAITPSKKDVEGGLLVADEAPTAEAKAAQSKFYRDLHERELDLQDRLERAQKDGGIEEVRKATQDLSAHYREAELLAQIQGHDIERLRSWAEGEVASKRLKELEMQKLRQEAEEIRADFEARIDIRLENRHAQLEAEAAEAIRSKTLEESAEAVKKLREFQKGLKESRAEYEEAVRQVLADEARQLANAGERFSPQEFDAKVDQALEAARKERKDAEARGEKPELPTENQLRERLETSLERLADRLKRTAEMVGLKTEIARKHIEAISTQYGKELETSLQDLKQRRREADLGVAKLRTEELSDEIRTLEHKQRSGLSEGFTKSDAVELARLRIERQMLQNEIAIANSNWLTANRVLSRAEKALVPLQKEFERAQSAVKLESLKAGRSGLESAKTSAEEIAKVAKEAKRQLPQLMEEISRQTKALDAKIKELSDKAGDKKEGSEELTSLKEKRAKLEKLAEELATQELTKERANSLINTIKEAAKENAAARGVSAERVEAQGGFVAMGGRRAPGIEGAVEKLLSDPNLKVDGKNDGSTKIAEYEKAFTKQLDGFAKSSRFREIAARSELDANRYASRYHAANNKVAKTIAKVMQDRAENRQHNASVGEVISRMSVEGRKALEAETRTEDQAKLIVSEVEKQMAKRSPFMERVEAKRAELINGRKLSESELAAIEAKALENVWKTPEQREALIKLFTGSSIELGTGGGKTLLSALFGMGKEADGSTVQVTLLQPSKDLANKFFSDKVGESNVVDVLTWLSEATGVKRTAHKVEDLYAKYQAGNHKPLLDALRDASGLLVMSRDTHGFIELAAESDAQLRAALYDKLPNSRRRLLMDEVHKLSESMSFILGDASNKVLSAQDPAWLQSMFLKRQVRDGRIHMVDSMKAYNHARKSGLSVFYYDVAKQEMYLTPNAVQMIQRGSRKSSFGEISTSNIKEFYKAWAQAATRNGGAIIDVVDGVERVVPVDTTGTPQPMRSYHNKHYAAGFAAFHDKGAETVRLTETKMQISESQALKRYDSIQGMTATAEGARTLLRNKIGARFESLEANSAFKHANIRYVAEGEVLRMQEYASQAERFIRTLEATMPNRLARMLAAELSPEQTAELTALLRGRGLTVEVVNGSKLEDTNYADHIRGGGYEAWLAANDAGRARLKKEFETAVETWKNEGAVGYAPIAPWVKPAQVVILEGPAGKAAGKTGTDWRGDMFKIGNSSYDTASDHQQWKGRGERGDKKLTGNDVVKTVDEYLERIQDPAFREKLQKGKIYVAIREYWVETRVHSEAMAHIEMQVEELTRLWKDKAGVTFVEQPRDGAKDGEVKENVSLLDLLNRRHSLTDAERGELVRHFFQEVESTRGMLSEAREVNLKTGRLQFLQEMSRVVKGTKAEKLIPQFIQEATQEKGGEASYTPEDMTINAEKRAIQDWERERKATIDMLEKFKSEVGDSKSAEEIDTYIDTLRELKADNIKASEGLSGREVTTFRDALAYGKQLSKDMLSIEISQPEKMVQAEAAIEREIHKLKKNAPLASGSDVETERTLIEHRKLDPGVAAASGRTSTVAAFRVQQMARQALAQSGSAKPSALVQAVAGLSVDEIKAFLSNEAGIANVPTASPRQVAHDAADLGKYYVDQWREARRGISYKATELMSSGTDLKGIIGLTVKVASPVLAIPYAFVPAKSDAGNRAGMLVKAATEFKGFDFGPAITRALQDQPGAKGHLSDQKIADAAADAAKSETAQDAKDLRADEVETMLKGARKAAVVGQKETVESGKGFTAVKTAKGIVLKISQMTAPAALKAISLIELSKVTGEEVFIELPAASSDRRDAIEALITETTADNASKARVQVSRKGARGKTAPSTGLKAVARAKALYKDVLGSRDGGGSIFDLDRAIESLRQLQGMEQSVASRPGAEGFKRYIEMMRADADAAIERLRIVAPQLDAAMKNGLIDKKKLPADLRDLLPRLFEELAQAANNAAARAAIESYQRAVGDAYVAAGMPMGLPANAYILKPSLKLRDLMLSKDKWTDSLEQKKGRAKVAKKSAKRVDDRLEKLLHAELQKARTLAAGKPLILVMPEGVSDETFARVKAGLAGFDPDANIITPDTLADYEKISAQNRKKGEEFARTSLPSYMKSREGFLKKSDLMSLLDPRSGKGFVLKGRARMAAPLVLTSVALVFSLATLPATGLFGIATFVGSLYMKINFGLIAADLLAGGFKFARANRDHSAEEVLTPTSSANLSEIPLPDIGTRESFLQRHALRLGIGATAIVGYLALPTISFGQTVAVSAQAAAAPSAGALLAQSLTPWAPVVLGAALLIWAWNRWGKPQAPVTAPSRSQRIAAILSNA
jgi:hypothetical protein